MRYILVLIAISLMSVRVLAQQAGKVEVQVATASEIIRYSDEFSSERCFTATALYDLTDIASIMVSFTHLDYKFDKVFNGHSYFVGGRPDIQRNVNMVLVGYRLINSNKARTFSQFGTVTLGVAHSSPSLPGYYYAPMPDTAYTAMKSGYTLAALTSVGIQVAPFSFFHLFAAIELSVPFDLGRFPGGISLKGGIGIPLSAH